MFILGQIDASTGVASGWQTYFMIIVYFVVLLAIGYYAYKQSTSNLDEYMLGGRSIGPYVTALSAGASDMSGWMIMGLPGEVYSIGLSATWLAIGLTVGAWLNYILVALKIISGIIIVVFFTLYTSVGMVSGGTLFESAFGMDYRLGIILTAGIVVLYTFFGGYLAVSLTDFFQGVIMLIAMVMVPIAALLTLNGLDTFHTVAEVKPTNLDWFKGTSVVSIIGLIAWGLGYFGQPHIIVRFMSIKSHKQLPTARRFGIGWMAISLLGACLVGLTGIAYIHDTSQTIDNPETIFILMSQVLFHPLVGGFFLAAILAAIMSTISSQLLVTSSALTQDFYKIITKKRGYEPDRDKEFVMVGRFAVLAVAIVAILLAWTPNDTILNLVGNAWAGFGAAFGPLVLMSLYWKGLTKNGAIAGMVTSSIVVLFWIMMKSHGGIFELYEIIPGFFTNIVVTVIVSSFTKKPDKEVIDNLDRMKRILKED